MDKKDLQNQIKESFLELAPDMTDVFERTLDAIDSTPTQVIAFPKKKTNCYMSMRLAAAVLLLVILAGAGAFLKLNTRTTKYAVLVDVNPSVELCLDKNYKLVKLHGINDDGKKLVGHINIKKGCTLDVALTSLIDTLNEEGYLTSGGSILYTLETGSGNQRLEELIVADTFKALNNRNIDSLTVACQTTSKDNKLSGQELLENRLMSEYNYTNEQLKSMKVSDMLSTLSKEGDSSVTLHTEADINVEPSAEASTEGTTEATDTAVATTDTTKVTTETASTEYTPAYSDNTEQPTPATDASGNKADDNRNNDSGKDNKDDKADTDKTNNKDKDKNTNNGNKDKDKDKDKTNNKDKNKNTNNGNKDKDKSNNGNKKAE